MAHGGSDCHPLIGLNSQPSHRLNRQMAKGESVFTWPSPKNTNHSRGWHSNFTQLNMSCLCSSLSSTIIIIANSQETGPFCPVNLASYHSRIDCNRNLWFQPHRKTTLQRKLRPSSKIIFCMTPVLCCPSIPSCTLLACFMLVAESTTPRYLTPVNTLSSSMENTMWLNVLNTCACYQFLVL